MRRIYIRAAEQISLQQPLSEAWMESPVRVDAPWAPAQDPDFKAWLSAGESRRLGRILKRALVSLLTIVRKTGVEHPDAICVGTGLGCMVNTERILETLCNEGESMVSPTHFMQSTHNTIASLLAIHTRSHGYNITYSHKDLSFDLALLDAWLQFRQGRIHTAVVGGYDELTASYYTLLRRIGYLGAEGEGPGSEAAATLLVTDDRSDALCELAGLRILYRPGDGELHEALDRLLDGAGVARDALSGVVTGVNGHRANDAFYERFTAQLLPGVPTLHYKHLFGTSYTAPAYAPYVAAHCLHRGVIPPTLVCGTTPLRDGAPQTLLLVNQRDGKQWSLQLLRSVCGN